MKKYTLSILLLFIYIATMLIPYYLTTIAHIYDAKNSLFVLHEGVFHLPSLVYILLSAILLHLSIDSKATLFRERKY